MLIAHRELGPISQPGQLSARRSAGSIQIKKQVVSFALFFSLFQFYLCSDHWSYSLMSLTKKKSFAVNFWTLIVGRRGIKSSFSSLPDHSEYFILP